MSDKKITSMNKFEKKKIVLKGEQDNKERKGKALTDDELRKYKHQEDVRFEDGTMAGVLLDASSLEQDFTMCEAVFHIIALFSCIWLGFGLQTQNMYHISRSTPEGLSFFGDFQHTVFDFEAINNMDKLEEWMGRVVLDHYRDERPAFEDFNVVLEAEEKEREERGGGLATPKPNWNGCARTMRALNEYDSAIYHGISISQQRGSVKRGVFVASQEAYGTSYLNNLTVGGVSGGGGDGLDGASAGAAAAQGGSSRRYVRHTWSPVHGLVRNGSMAGGTTFAGAYGGHNVVSEGPGPGGPGGHEGTGGSAADEHAESHGSAPMNTEVWGRIHGTHHIYNKGHSKYDIPWRYAPRDRSLGPPKDAFSFHTTLSSWSNDDEKIYDADGELDEKAMMLTRSAGMTAYVEEDS